MLNPCCHLKLVEMLWLFIDALYFWKDVNVCINLPFRGFSASEYQFSYEYIGQHDVGLSLQDHNIISYLNIPLEL